MGTKEREMSGQMTFAEHQGLSRRRKLTRRERFLAEMDAVGGPD